MKKYNSGNPGGFTLLIILGVIGFLLILLTGIFKVVTLELKDTRNMDYYLKSKGAAEAGQELALLQLKEERFGYDGEVVYDPTSPRADKSIILTEDPTDQYNYHQNKDVSLGYDIQSETGFYESTLEPGGFQVIPLFVKKDGVLAVPSLEPSVNITSGTANDFAWNIIGEVNGEPVGISGNNAFDFNETVTVKSITAGVSGGYCPNGQCESFFSLRDISVTDFLQDVDNTDNNYLTIFNKGSNDITYEVSANSGNNFTKPVTTIISQAKIGEIKQNIQLEIFNDKYFDVLKYSLFDG